jgi:hypothetical protein
MIQQQRGKVQDWTPLQFHLECLLLLLGGLGGFLLQGLDGGLVGLDFAAVGLDLFVRRRKR